MAMEVDHKDIIRNNYEFLRDGIEPKPLADYLFKEKKITSTQHESISKYPGTDATKECLKILMSSGPAFKSFITFLESDSARDFILEELLKDMVEEIRVVMIGKTGVGKSLLGNNILDHKSFSSLGCSQSIAKQNKRGERMVDKYCKLVLVDTPGLFYTNTKDNMETAKILESTVKQTTPGPHIFLLVVTIGRFTAEERATFEFLKDLFGSHVTNYLIIIFTGKDTLDFDNLDFEIFINTACDDLKSIVEQCQGKMTINNRASREEVTRSVDEILKLIKRVYLQNDKKYYTDGMLTEALKKFKEKRRLQAEKAGRRERELEEEKKNLEQEKRDDKIKFEALRKDEEKIQKMYEDERKEKEKLRLQAGEADRRERNMEEEMKKLKQDKRDDKNKFEALRKDKEEIKKKYEDERKEKEKLRLQAGEAHRRERKMEEEMRTVREEAREREIKLEGEKKKVEEGARERERELEADKKRVEVEARGRERKLEGNYADMFLLPLKRITLVSKT